MMSKVKAIWGYGLAFLGVPIVLVMLFEMSSWMNLLVSTTGVTISPWISGGEVARTVDHDAYQTRVHRPVFEALVGERKEGFVQVDWAPVGSLPERIVEEIDFDGDGRVDFHVEWDRASDQAVLTPYNPHVLALEGTYHLREAWAIRVALRNSAR